MVDRWRWCPFGPGELQAQVALTWKKTWNNRLERVDYSCFISLTVCKPQQVVWCWLLLTTRASSTVDLHFWVYKYFVVLCSRSVADNHLQPLKNFILWKQYQCIPFDIYLFISFATCMNAQLQSCCIYSWLLHVASMLSPKVKVGWDDSWAPVTWTQ